MTKESPRRASIRGALSRGNGSLHDGAPLIVVICSHKGGVGKTTIAAGLAAALAETGETVTLLDFDPLGSASRILAGEVPRKGAFEFLCGQSAAALSVPSRFEGLRVIPGTTLLRLAELDEPVRDLDHAALRRRLLSEIGPEGIILIDCPPGLGVTAVTAMAAADMVLIPVVPDHFALPALAQTIEVAEAAAETGAIRILLNLADSDDPGAERVTEVIRQRYPRLLLPFRFNRVPSGRLTAVEALAPACLQLSALLLEREGAPAPGLPSPLIAEMRRSTRLLFSRAALGLFLSFAASAGAHLAAVYHSIQLERQIPRKEPLHFLGAVNLRAWKG